MLAPILLVVLRQGNRSPEFRQLWNDSKFNRGPLVSLILIKCLLCIGILMTVVASLFDTASGMGFAVSLALLTGIVFSKRLRRRSFEMEERLRENFGGDDTADAERPLNEGQLPFEQLHMAEFGVAAESIVAGRTLREIDFRRRYGVTVVAIRRGERRLQLPDGHTMLFPYDRLTVVGTDEEFRIFHRVLDEQRSERKRRREEKTATALRIGSYTLPARSALDGTTLGEAEVRPPRLGAGAGHRTPRRAGDESLRRRTAPCGRRSLGSGRPAAHEALLRGRPAGVAHGPAAAHRPVTIRSNSPRSAAIRVAPAPVSSARLP